MLGRAGDTKIVICEIILRDLWGDIFALCGHALPPLNRSTASARRICECKTELEYSKPHSSAGAGSPIGQKTKILFTGPSTPELTPSIKPVLPAGIQQAPLPAVAAREHKIARVLDFGFCERRRLLRTGN
jgi:hypothetical protein